MLVVRKYGGSCLKDVSSFKCIAKQIAVASEIENPVIVVSAIMGETDRLYQKASCLAPESDLSRRSKRELDSVLTTGEQVSAGLLAIALNELGVPARAYTAKDLGIQVNGGGKVVGIRMIDHLRRDIVRGIIPIVTGFQAVNNKGDIVTLGRNSSDLTAVVLAYYLGADECRLHKDVDGVFEEDPKRAANQKCLVSIELNDIIKIVKKGSQIVSLSALEYLSKRFIPLRVMSAKEGSIGTLVYKKEKTVRSVYTNRTKFLFRDYIAKVLKHLFIDHRTVYRKYL